jgi:hypothetical protein
MVEHGHRPALVVVPGLPGPWQFVAPAVHALSAHFHVLAASLGPECNLDVEAQRIYDLRRDPAGADFIARERRFVHDDNVEAGVAKLPRTG